MAKTFDDTKVLEQDDENETPYEEYRIDCAWCLDEQGLPLGNGSHGICSPHAIKVLKDWQDSKVQRRVF
jgi:hypothetical protein